MVVTRAKQLDYWRPTFSYKYPNANVAEQVMAMELRWSVHVQMLFSQLESTASDVCAPRIGGDRVSEFLAEYLRQTEVPIEALSEVCAYWRNVGCARVQGAL